MDFRGDRRPATLGTGPPTTREMAPPSTAGPMARERTSSLSTTRARSLGSPQLSAAPSSLTGNEGAAAELLRSQLVSREETQRRLRNSETSWAVTDLGSSCVCPRSRLEGGRRPPASVTCMLPRRTLSLACVSLRSPAPRATQMGACAPPRTAAGRAASVARESDSATQRSRVGRVGGDGGRRRGGGGGGGGAERS